jgi:hypothetical protein
MADPPKKRATYEDVLNAPEHMVAEIIDGDLLLFPLLRTLEVLRRHETSWLVVATYQGDAKVRAEPFDAIELELGILWADVQL